jgi:hypothetical protein
VISLGGLLGLILRIVNLIALAGGIYALVHAIRQRSDAFTAADKLTKPIWLAILAVASLVLLGGAFGGGLLGLIACVAVGVYLADVRPKVDEIQRPRW